jgi:predicted nucleic acid-binding protein
MPASTSPVHPIPNSYVLDTNVLSLFAKINRLDLLLQLAIGSLYLTPTIQLELEVGLDNGVEYLANALRLIHTGKLQVMPLNEIDRQFMRTLPNKLGDGEAEAIALCRRANLTLISHDRKVINYCKQEGINSIRLTTLVDQLKNADLLTEVEIRTMFSL